MKLSLQPACEGGRFVHPRERNRARNEPGGLGRIQFIRHLVVLLVWGHSGGACRCFLSPLSLFIAPRLFGARGLLTAVAAASRSHTCTSGLAPRVPSLGRGTTSPRRCTSCCTVTAALGDRRAPEQVHPGPPPPCRGQRGPPPLPQAPAELAAPRAEQQAGSGRL